MVVAEPQPSSPRLSYQRLGPAHLGQLHALLVDPHVRRFLLDGQVVTADWAAGALEKSNRTFAERGVGLWLVFERRVERGAPIGFAGFFVVEELGPELQLIYAILPAHTGQGYAREAAATLIGFSRAEAAFGAISATVDEPNRGSICVLERLGFQRAGDHPGAFGPIRTYVLPAGRPPLELRTERLVLRPWRDDDLAPFAGLNADPRVMEHFPAVLSRMESDALAKRIRTTFADRGYGLWALELRGTAQFIGFAGLAEPSFASHFTPCVEVGWRLAFEHWGRGYATEAATAAVDAGFVHLGLDEIVSFTVPANTRSRRVMQRLGMAHDPGGDFEHPHLPVGHPLRRHVLYRLDRPTWRAIPAATGRPAVPQAARLQVAWRFPLSRK